MQHLYHRETFKLFFYGAIGKSVFAALYHIAYLSPVN